MKISLIHASRSRPELAISVANNWIAKSQGAEIEYIFSLDADDNWKEYASLFRGAVYDDTRISVKLLTAPNKSAIEAINYAATRATGDLLIAVSDDFSCPEHWDTELLKHLEGKSDFCAKHRMAYNLG